MFLELERRYPELKSSIAEMLFGEYQRCQSEAAEIGRQQDLPALSQPEEIWRHACLEGFRIENDASSTIPYLRLAYTVDWDQDRFFYLHLWNWEAVRLTMVHG